MVVSIWLFFCVLVPLAMVIGGLLMARHELSVRDHCRQAEGMVVGRRCGEGPPCGAVIAFTDERGAFRQEISSGRDGDIGDRRTVCFMPGGEGAEVYFAGDERSGLVMAFAGFAWLVMLARFLIPGRRPPTESPG